MSEPIHSQGTALPPGSLPGRIRSHFLGRRMPWLALAAVLVICVVLLRIQGRRWWCACGELYPWAGDIWSGHNSQHLLDPYSFTHLLHGVLVCWLLAWICPRLPLAWRFPLAVALEALFEVMENTAFGIQRYRAATTALDYQGDAIANSLGDILCYSGGYALALRLGPWGSLALFLATEVALLIWIRDSLLLNVLMLVYPVEAIRTWQLGR